MLGIIKSSPILVLGTTVLTLFSIMSDAHAYESDQYTNRTNSVADSLIPIDDQVNLAIQKILHQKRVPQTEKAFAQAVYRELGGIYWADKIERWAARSPTVDKYPQTRHKSIYRSMPVWATRVNYVFGVGRTIRVNGVLVGSDKLGHFFSQGYKYFLRELRAWSEEKVLQRGAFVENWLFGKFTTGVYSNADLVANYEGWRFYQSLFRDQVTPGKSAILTRQDARLMQQRPFTLADHINDYWDEGLNPSYNTKSLNKRLRQAILALCDEYYEQPAFFIISDDAGLWKKYQHIGLKDARENRFETICDKPTMSGGMTPP